MVLRPSKRGYGRRTLQILRMGISTLHSWAEYDYHNHGDAPVDAYPNRLAMLFCLQGGKDIDPLIYR